VWGFGRAIALWGFNAVQQFRADCDIELCRKVLIAALALMGAQHANCPAKSYYFPATREAGLVQISNALIDREQSARLRLNRVSEPPLPAEHGNFVHQQNDYGR
jgi:hypothetical protein